MQELQLYIQDQRVDLFDDEKVSLTQSIQNIKDISKVFTDFTKSFTIPASKNNNKIFKHYYNFSIENGFDGRRKVDANIELNYVPFKKGKVELMDVELRNNVPYFYRITFFGNTIALSDLLGDKTLSVLEDFNDIDLTYSSGSIRTGLGNLPSASDVIVPLITHTQRLIYDSTSSNHDTDNIADTGGSQNIHGVDWKQLKYALRVDRIIRAIEADFDITFSDDFFTSTNAPYYNLFMWLHRKKGAVATLGDINQSIMKGFTPTSLDVDTQTQMTNIYNLSVFGEEDNYNVATLTFSTASTTPYRYRIEYNGEKLEESDLVTGNQVVDVRALQGGVLKQGNYVILIASNNNLSFSSIKWDITYIDGVNVGDVIYDTGLYVYSSIFKFLIKEQIPEMKIIDFLTGLFKMFNLTAYVEDDIIVVKKLDDFYASGTSYDISKYVKNDKFTVAKSLPYGQIKFEYEDTGTILAEQYNKLSGKEWGSTYGFDVDKGDDDYDLNGDEYNVKIPFGHIMNERLVDQIDETLSSVQYGYYVDDNQDSYIGKPLLFYPIQIQSQDNISFVNTETSKSILFNYNIPSNSLSLDSSVSKVNIHFGNEGNEYASDEDFSDTLFEVYYKNYIKSVFNVKNRLTKVDAYLPLSILIKYTLADRFVINNNSYKINSITTDLTTGKSSLELLNDL